MKYTIRKLLFLLSLVSIVATPFLVAEYRSLTTTDPFILIARDIENYDRGEVDVLYVVQNESDKTGIVLLAYIPNYPEWTERQGLPNFNQAVIRAIARQNFESVIIFIGWDFPPSEFRVQGTWSCPEMRRLACEWEKVPSVVVSEDFITWPGIGNP